MKKKTCESTNLAPAETAFRSLLRTFGLLRQVMEPYFARFGISGSQWGALRALQRGEQEGLPGLALGELGTRLLVRPPSVSGVVDRLERQGLVERRASEADHRVRQVRLTTAGRQLVERVLAEHGGQVQRVMGGLRPDEQRRMLALMERLRAHLGDLAQSPKGPKI